MTYNTEGLTTGFTDELQRQQQQEDPQEEPVHGIEIESERENNNTNNPTNPNANTRTRTISKFDAIQHLMKGNLGPGCLNIPHAFALSGYLLGTLLFLLVAIQGIYSMVLLVYCKQCIQQYNTNQRHATRTAKLRRKEQQSNDTNDSMDHNETTTIHVPPLPAAICYDCTTFMDIAYVSHGPIGSIIVQILLFVLQGGVCCVFLSLIATNLHASFPILKLEECVFVVTVLLFVVVLLRDLKELKWLSLSANILMIVAILTASLSALSVIFWNHNNDDENDNSAKKYTTNPAAIATFISSMFYSFEGIGLVMPVENSYVGYKEKHNNNNTARNENNQNNNEKVTTATKLLTTTNNNNANYTNTNDEEESIETTNNNDDAEEELRRIISSRIESFLNPVLIGSMSMVGILFLLIGITCGPAFPDIVDGSVTAYLTTKYPDNPWYQLVNIGVMIAVFFTFPLQLTPAMEVLQVWFGPGCDPQCWCAGTSNNTVSSVRNSNRTEDRTTGIITGGGISHRRQRRRLGSRQRGGRHTRISQQDDNDTNNNENGDDDAGDENENHFQDEEEVAPNPSSSNGNGNNYHQDGLVAVPVLSGQQQQQHTTTNNFNITMRNNTKNNNCFGPYEWIFRRCVVVFCCAIIVISVNDLGLLMSLFGSIGNTGLAAMPCIIHLKLMSMPSLLSSNDDETRTDDTDTTGTDTDDMNSDEPENNTSTTSATNRKTTTIAPFNFMLMSIDICTIVLSFCVAITGVIFSLQELL